jgi:hypothetical protein
MKSRKINQLRNLKYLDKFKHTLAPFESASMFAELSLSSELVFADSSSNSSSVQ